MGGLKDQHAMEWKKEQLPWEDKKLELEDEKRKQNDHCGEVKEDVKMQQEEVQKEQKDWSFESDRFQTIGVGPRSIQKTRGEFWTFKKWREGNHHFQKVRLSIEQV
jgi:hypothetical protein